MLLFIIVFLFGNVYAAVRVSDTTAWQLNNSQYSYTGFFLPYNTSIDFLLYVNYKIQNCAIIECPQNALTCDSVLVKSGVEFSVVSNFLIKCIVNTHAEFWCGIPHVYPCQDLGDEVPQIVIAADVEGLVGGMIGLYLVLFIAFFFKYRAWRI